MNNFKNLDSFESIKYSNLDLITGGNCQFTEEEDKSDEIGGMPVLVAEFLAMGPSRKFDNGPSVKFDIGPSKKFDQ